MKKKILNDTEITNVESKIRAFEENTGCELVVAIAQESDPYPAAPLRFAFIVMIILSLIATYFLSFHFDSILVFGQIILFLLFIPIGSLKFIKKRILVPVEVNREVNEKSVELFHELCTTKTTHRVSTFLYFSLLERQIRLLVDKDLYEKIEQSQLDSIVANLSAEIKQKKFSEGIVHSIERIEELVSNAFGQKLEQIPPDQIKNQIFWV